MTGPDHYLEGEQVLASLDIPRDAALDTSLSLEERREASAMLHAMATAALAHFTAALAAATAINDYPDGAPVDDRRAWQAAAGVWKPGGAR